MSKKIKDYLEEFYAFSSKASEVNRQLALAGVAIVWIFKNPEGSAKLLPEGLIMPLIFLIISLSIDLLHYLIGTIIWGIYFEYKEYQVNKGKIQDGNIKAPNILSYIITALFFLKIIAMCVAYIQLLQFLSGKI
jgi:hypothetical protein